MSGAWSLIGCALGLTCWPGASAIRRQRLRIVLAAGRPAGLRRPDRAVLLTRAVPTAALAAGAAGAVWSTPVVAVLAAGCAALLARALLRRRTDGERTRRLRALAESLGVLAAEVRAGRSTAAATETAVATCADPSTAVELARAVRAHGPAPPEDDEHARALGRVGAAVRLSSRTGCSLAAVLAAVEDDLRARLTAADELRAAVAGPRASATVLAGLPVLGLALGAGVGADPWGVLTTTVTGQLLLVAGVALEVAGVVWSGRLVARAVAR